MARLNPYLRRFKVRKPQIRPIAIELGGRVAQDRKKLLDSWPDCTVDTELDLEAVSLGAELSAWRLKSGMTQSPR